MKKIVKIILASAIYTGSILVIQDAGEHVGLAVGELVFDGIKEIPEEVSGIKAFTKKALLKERELLRKIFKSSHKKEEDIVLTKDDEEILKDIEKEVSQL